MENPEVENAEIVKQFYDSYRQLCSDERQSFYEYVQSKFEVRIKQFSDKSFARFVHGYSFLTLISKNTGGGASPDGCTDKTDSNACQNAIGWNSTGISEEIIDELTNRIHFYQYMIWVLLVSVVKATSEQADIENIPDRAISRSLTLLKLFRQSTIELIDTSAKVISMIVVMTENSTMASKSSKGKDEDNLWSPLTASRSEGSANYVSNVRHGFSTQTSVGAAVNSVASEDGKRTEFFRDHILQKAVELKDSIEDWALQIIGKLLLFSCLC